MRQSSSNPPPTTAGFLSQSLAALLNHLLQREQWACARLLPFAGRSLRITTGMTVDACLQITPGGTLIAIPTIQAPDVCIHLDFSPGDLLDPNPEALLTRARIQGQAALAESFGFVLRNLHWHATDDLSDWIGDIPAQRLVNAARASAFATRRRISGLAASASEHLVHETGILATPALLANLLNQERQFMEQLQRLETRIQGLERQIT